MFSLKKKNWGEAHREPHPHNSWRAQSSGFALNWGGGGPRAGTLHPRLGVHSLQHPSSMFINFYRSNTVFPNPNFLATPLDPNARIVPRLCISIEIILLIKSLTAGWKNFSKISAWLTHHTGTHSSLLGIIAPNASILVHAKCTKIVGGWGSAPDPTGGAYSAPRPPSCYGLGWRFGN